MIAAYRLKGLGWFASCVAIVLGFYLVSLQVAAERKKLDRMNAQILTAQRDIRALETEFDTRANLAQLERWNGDTLALAAPIAGQYVSDEAQLASMDVTSGNGAMIQTASLVVPSAPVGLPAIPTPNPDLPAVPHPATSAPAPVQMAALTPAPRMTAAAVLRAPRLRALEPVAPRSTPGLARKVNAERAVAAVAKVRPEAVAMLDRKLLSDTTLGDILSGARAEAGRRR
ncbi:hypothetical protein [Sphingomonas aerophila]|uniref:Colicin transporter n=1 Tax=Sphingomonas aerophila TaxID=1344948 RepID=A0A7W9BEI2_9SPHN|nr:hypothetical protein [Sphingomonas aerophila]MBB5715770.1 hypothetical protein [Sphingomonas aerophila]